MRTSSRNWAIGITILAFLAIFYFFSDIVAYILIAWVFSMIGQPLMGFYQRKLQFGKFKAGPTVCAVLTIFSFLIIFGVIIMFFIPPIVEQARNLTGVDYTAITKSLEHPLEQINEQLVRLGINEPGGLRAEDRLKNNLKTWFEPAQIGNFFGSVIGFAGNFVITIFSVLFILFFFLKEQGLFLRLFTSVVPNDSETYVSNAIDEISRMLTRYFGGVLVQVTIIAVIVSLALTLLGIQNALLIGFFAAIINVIPYIGPIIGAAFGTFITISSNLDLEFYTQMLPLIMKVIGVFVGMQMLDNFILQPYIFSNSVLAHPLEIFIIVLVGAQLNGIVGMVLAIPVYTVFRVIAKVFLSQYKIVQRLTEGMDIDNHTKHT